MQRAGGLVGVSKMRHAVHGPKRCCDSGAQDKNQNRLLTHFLLLALLTPGCNLEGPVEPVVLESGWGVL